VAPPPEAEVTLVAPVGDVRVARAAASAAAAATRVDVAEPAGACTAETFSDTGDPCDPTAGHPWNATRALASTNTSAAPASSDPAVPNPARYARVARMPLDGIGRKVRTL
jgi:hypothetical protein